MMAMMAWSDLSIVLTIVGSVLLSYAILIVGMIVLAVKGSRDE